MAIWQLCHEMASTDRKLKLHEVAEALKKSKGSVFTILQGHLSMTKLCSKWVPRLLTVDQKQQRSNDSERCFELFQRNKKDAFQLLNPQTDSNSNVKTTPKVRRVVSALILEPSPI